MLMVARNEQCPRRAKTSPADWQCNGLPGLAAAFLLAQTQISLFFHGRATYPLVYDERGNCESLTMQAVRFEPLSNKTESELCELANQALGPFSLVVECQMVAARDGKPAPGFERFSSSMCNSHGRQA
jgi:hypothetical protein